MIAPIKQLLYERMSVDLAEQEFSVGYGIADIVGAKLCNENCQKREKLGLAFPFDHIHFISVLLSLHQNRWTSFTNLSKRIAISENTLRKKILPKLIKLNTIERKDDFFRLCIYIPKPTQNLIAVEAKQKKWKEAILQARRYTYFAEETYVATWAETIRLVDRNLLYRHRLGLIAVTDDYAEVIVKAPKRQAREPKLNLYSAEFFYGQALSNGTL